MEPIDIELIAEEIVAKFKMRYGLVSNEDGLKATIVAVLSSYTIAEK